MIKKLSSLKDKIESKKVGSKEQKPKVGAKLINKKAKK